MQKVFHVGTREILPQIFIKIETQQHKRIEINRRVRLETRRRPGKKDRLSMLRQLLQTEAANIASPGSEITCSFN